MSERRGQALTALKAAFPHTLPILTGFLVLGTAHGVLMSAAGFAWWWPLLTSVVIFGGSLEFVATSLLQAPFAPLQSLLTGLLVQARHLFYGIAMLERYEGMGRKKPYMIFSLCDETFSINCTVDVPEGVDRELFMFFVGLLDQSYWVVGSLLGGLLGDFIPFDTTGMDFAMTAMFIVIALEQWLKDDRHFSALSGLLCSLAALMIFGQDSFLIPAMALILAALLLGRGIYGGEGNAPGGDGSAPGGDGSAPGGEGNAPGGDGSAPVMEGSASGGEEARS